jgi:hypothetical protein
MSSIHPDAVPDGTATEPPHGTVAEPPNGTATEPLAGVGCARGCLRDLHFSVAILSGGLLAILILFLICELESDKCVDDFFSGGFPLWLVLAIVACMFLCEAWNSATFGYLTHVNTTETTLEFMNRLYRGVPYIGWHIQCYHYETHTNTYTETDSEGRSVTRTETVTETVYTHSASGSLQFSSWVDTSEQLDLCEITKYQMTKIDLAKTFTADEGYTDQKGMFIRVNNRDTHYEFTESYEIPGFTPYVLTMVDLAQKPCMAHLGWFLLSQLTVLFALPYRMWLSSVTGKVTTTVSKAITTTPF